MLARGEKLRVEHVSRQFRNSQGVVHALQDVSLSVADGEFVCLLGPSGCGKSTLLDIVAGLTQPDEGTILFDGKPIEGPGRHRLVMFQESALFPWLDAMGNVKFGLKLKRTLKARERREIAQQHLELVGLKGFEHAHVHQLSGGMKQRVALARALAPNPQMLLMDEPFAALDAMTRDQLYDDIQRIWAEKKRTIIFVTHNVREAVCLGDRVVVMSPRPGRIATQFMIDLPRPRDINAANISDMATTIADALRAAAGVPAAHGDGG